MKKILFSLIAALGLIAGSAQAAGGGIAWDKAPNKTNDLGALQNGAKLFVNYCIGCHSAAYMRYNRLTDIGLTEGQIKDNLLFTTEKIGDTMKATITERAFIARMKRHLTKEGGRLCASRYGTRAYQNLGLARPANAWV